MKKLKELALMEAKRRQAEQDKIQLRQALKKKQDDEAKALLDAEEKAQRELEESTKPMTKPAEKGLSIDHSEDKVYRFTLSSCYRNKSHFLELAYDTESETKVVILKPVSTDMTVDVDSIEMAEDFDDRNNYLKKWTPANTLTAIPAWINSLQSNKCIKRVIDNGIVEYGAVIDTGAYDSVVELFLWGTKASGLIRLERMDSVVNTFTTETSWFASFQGSSSGIRPYIISSDAVRVNYMSEGNSASLPRRVKKRVPMEFRYWNEEDHTRKCLVRNNLVTQLNEGRIFLPLGEETNGRYSVIKVWTPREAEVYHLQVQNKGMFKVNTFTDITSFNKMDDEICFTNSETDFDIEFGKEGTIELSDKPQFARAIDWGDCVVYENSKNRKTVKFLGAKMRDVLQFVKHPETGWKASILESSKNSGQDLSNAQIDEIIEMSKAKAERNAIAEKVCCSSRTVYTYQKILGYV